MKNIILILIIFSMLGCKVQRPLVKEVPIQYRERIVERMMPVQIAADSANIWALFECDSSKQVVMRQLREEKTKRMQADYSFQDGKLTYRLISVHDTVYLPGKEITIEKEVPVRVEVPVEVNKLTQWQIIQIWAGRLLLLIGFLYAAKMAVNKYLNKF